MKPCYCCYPAAFSDCCEPLLSGAKSAENAEQLMRSRFSAYCTDNYQYILNTYGDIQQRGMTVESLAASAQNSIWLGLQVIQHRIISATSQQVEFIATYADKGNTFIMHEISQFELQSGQWRYTNGDMQADTGKVKLSRNAPCPCCSGKKFKQCCLNKV